MLLNEEDWKGRLRLSKFDNVSYFLEPKHSGETKGKIQKVAVNPDAHRVLMSPEKIKYEQK